MDIDSLRNRGATDSGAVDAYLGHVIKKIEVDFKKISAPQTSHVILDIEKEGVHYLVVCRHDGPEIAVGTGPATDTVIAQTTNSPSPALSPREHEIACLVAEGYANKTIASALDISVWTVSSHLRRIFTKFGVSSRAAMVARLLGTSADQPAAPRPSAKGS